MKNNNPLKLVVGQRMWLKPSEYHTKKEDRVVKECLIGEIKNNYFTLLEIPFTKYDIHTLTEITKTNYISKCYTTFEEINEIEEIAKLKAEIIDFFVGFNKKLDLTVIQLREIKEIISENK